MSLPLHFSFIFLIYKGPLRRSRRRGGDDPGAGQHGAEAVRGALGGGRGRVVGRRSGGASFLSPFFFPFSVISVVVDIVKLKQPRVSLPGLVVARHGWDQRRERPPPADPAAATVPLSSLLPSLFLVEKVDKGAPGAVQGDEVELHGPGGA